MKRTEMQELCSDSDGREMLQKMLTKKIGAVSPQLDEIARREAEIKRLQEANAEAKRKIETQRNWIGRAESVLVEIGTMSAGECLVYGKEKNATITVDSTPAAPEPEPAVA